MRHREVSEHRGPSDTKAEKWEYTHARADARSLSMERGGSGCPGGYHGEELWSCIVIDAGDGIGLRLIC